MPESSLVSVGVFLIVLACLPFAVNWAKRHSLRGGEDANGKSRFISALAVGPHQRVVTVEVGPEGRRVWLTLGVTTQNISCLHCVESDLESKPLTGLQSSRPEPEK